MPKKTRWVIDLDIEELEEERSTHAVARLHRDGTSLEGTGTAHRHPRDLDLARVGDDLAAARALVELASLLQTDAGQVLEKFGATSPPPEA
ncbi:dsRBD fold-containing protein [Catellatospora vulcania]|uniref:dsRBD fold-containing protein n=1 Tax=Catellatospora vulcania TaxID=1460450 RepID=UPI0012D3C80D|nr:dsRBD fold-containing protein [Catellatospora vulcania]